MLILLRGRDIIVSDGGGFYEPPPEWWPIVGEICKKYDVLLIADEVLSGFARTGKIFAVENWNIQPDIMTIAKGKENFICSLSMRN